MHKWCNLVDDMAKGKSKKNDIGKGGDNDKEDSIPSPDLTTSDNNNNANVDNADNSRNCSIFKKYPT